MDIIINLIKKELLTMVSEEINYIKDLWGAVEKMKDDFTKDEILDIADLYINVLTDKIQKLEEQKENK